MRAPGSNLAPAAVAVIALATSSDAEGTLRSAVEASSLASRMTIGAAVNEGYFDADDGSYSQTAASQYNLVTAENSCKFGATEKVQNQFSFDACDQVLGFAEENNMAFRGHNLCWGVYNPSWVDDGGFSSAELTRILQNHINNTLTHYKGKAVAWDVVNEAIEDSAPYGLKKNTWNNITASGDATDYIDVAFAAARAADPDTLLFYNDYNVASMDGWSAGKSDAMFSMVKGMRDRGVPIDGVGLQMHVGCGYDLVDGVRANMQRYSDIGVQTHVTELDLTCEQSASYDCTWSGEVEEQQGRLYADLLQACVDVEGCTNFETWGFTDAHTWIKGDSHPLPFYDDYSEKKAVAMMMDVLASAN
ncbi:hypothetical protein TeGR_g8384 [Tetraparma gracilis]|uniref:endo-1,4-beta-xylanase n=1 Tax=Tetraparma gracilis TaxID=2962635 RepID=A0ABQ6N4W8_9STRA|nr:hypothetical protein TeGR_g8384 [Tetraparma gracilis]